MKQDKARKAFDRAFRTSTTLEYVRQLEEDGERLRYSREEESWEMAVAVGSFELIAGLFASDMERETQDPSVRSLSSALHESPSVNVQHTGVDMCSDNDSLNSFMKGLSSDNESLALMKKVTFLSSDSDDVRMLTEDVLPEGVLPEDSAVRQGTRKRQQSAKANEAAAATSLGGGAPAKKKLKGAGTQIPGSKIKKKRDTTFLNNEDDDGEDSSDSDDESNREDADDGDPSDSDDESNSVLANFRKSNDVEYIKTLTPQDKDSIIRRVWKQRKSEAFVPRARGGAVDAVWTDSFFAFHPQHTGVKIKATTSYKARRMERWLETTGPSWFGTMNEPNKSRTQNEFFQLGVDVMPGANTPQGFGVYAKKSFVMTEDDRATFQKTMRMPGYALDTNALKKQNMTVKDVLDITSTPENGGLRSAIAHRSKKMETSISHGGTLGTLMNNGGQYAKFDYHAKLVGGDEKNSGDIATENICFDAEFVQFLKDNPKIAKSIVKEHLIVMGSPDDTFASTRKKLDCSIVIGDDTVIGLRVRCYYAMPNIGEAFVEGEQAFAAYSLDGVFMSELDTNDARYLGTNTESNGGYTLPMPKGKRSSSLSSPSLGNIVVAPASDADKEAASGADTGGNAPRADAGGETPRKSARELNANMQEKAAAALGPHISK